MTAKELAMALRAGRYRITNEAILQADTEEFLKKRGISYLREHRISAKDRIDFLIEGKIGLELKIKGQKRAIYRQLERYAAHECIEELLLMSFVPMGLPETINGKPIYFLNLGRMVF